VGCRAPGAGEAGRDVSAVFSQRWAFSEFGAAGFRGRGRIAMRGLAEVLAERQVARAVERRRKTRAMTEDFGGSAIMEQRPDGASERNNVVGKQQSLFGCVAESRRDD